MSARHVLEGEWSGYVSRQRRVVHREVVSDKRAAILNGMQIVYTDGTTLNLRTREARPREKVPALNAYGSLIREAEAAGGRVFVIRPKADPALALALADSLAEVRR